jgi:glycosyltransferase involved in cell wall biosynthesis
VPRAVPTAPDSQRTAWQVELSPVRSGRPRVGIVVANFNTRRLISHLIFSLYRLLGRSEFDQIVVVDNASTDGSRDLLDALDKAHLIHLIGNRRQQYHGPALTQGISWLAGRQDALAAGERLEYVWVIDSDVIVLRRDTVRHALQVFEQSQAAAVGQKAGDPTLNKVLQDNPEMLHPCTLLIDPTRIWRDPIPPFLEAGAPAWALQVAADAKGMRLVEFAFIADGYLLHLGRGTLREVADGNDTSNRYYGWAVNHRDHHFACKVDGAELLAAFAKLFEANVGDLTPGGLVASCVQEDILSLVVRRAEPTAICTP